MTIGRIRDYLLTERGLFLGAGIMAVLGLVVLDFSNDVSKRLEIRSDEYRLDLGLSENREAHERIYRQILAGSITPSGELLPQNDWIRQTQNDIRTFGMQVREVTPVVEETRRGEKRTKLVLVAEGSTGAWASYLHGLATSGSQVYVESFKAAPASDDSKQLRIDMVLAQFEVKG